MYSPVGSEGKLNSPFGVVEVVELPLCAFVRDRNIPGMTIYSLASLSFALVRA
jgi:hypothetical protein